MTRPSIKLYGGALATRQRPRTSLSPVWAAQRQQCEGHPRREAVACEWTRSIFASSSLTAEASSDSAHGNSKSVHLKRELIPLRRVKKPPARSHLLRSSPELIDALLTNSQLRKGAFRQSDAERLKALQHTFRTTGKQMDQLRTEHSRASSQIEQCARDLKTLKGAEKAEKQEEMTKWIADAKGIKERMDERVLKDISAEVGEIQSRVPNWTHPDVPIGDADNAIIRSVGGDFSLLPEEIRSSYATSEVVGSAIKHIEGEEQSKSEGHDHVTVAQRQGWYDAAVSNQVAGPNWPFLVGPLALLEHALTQYAMNKGLEAGFVPVCVPDVAKREILAGTGFAPRDDEAGQTYWLKEDDKSKAKQEATSDAGAMRSSNDLALAATAEITLAGFLAKTSVDADDLPIRLVASSHAFRAEAGARGQDSRGLYRVHQFTKTELFIVCQRDRSNEEFDRLWRLQEEIVKPLGIPYRVLDMPSEELGASAYRKYDIEAWMPGRGSWGEISSASNCTYHQSVLLNMTSNEEARDDGPRNPHTLNGTAMAVPRMIIALLENYGVSPTTNKIQLPIVLKPFWPQADVRNVEWIAVSGVEANAVEVDGVKATKRSALRRAVDRVREAAQRNGSDPASMVASFMILHELTAIIPLILLFYLFGLLGTGKAVMQWLLDASSATTLSEQDQGIVRKARSWLGNKIQEGMQRVERFGRRKGYFGFERGSSADLAASSTHNAQAMAGTFANAVAAYAIVKVLLPVRLAACFALSAPFARVCFEPLKRLAGRLRGGKRSKP